MKSGETEFFTKSNNSEDSCVGGHKMTDIRKMSTNMILDRIKEVCIRNKIDKAWMIGDFLAVQKLDTASLWVVIPDSYGSRLKNELEDDLSDNLYRISKVFLKSEVDNLKGRAFAIVFRKPRPELADQFRKHYILNHQLEPDEERLKRACKLYGVEYTPPEIK